MNASNHIEPTGSSGLAIHPSTRFMGKSLVYLSEVPSTMDFASELLVKNTPPPNEGTLVWADFQSRGRGQGNNVWQSTAGQNLTVSFILYPKFLQANNQFLLNEAVALSVADTAASITEEKVHIKWPNDVIIRGKKIAGILIQNTLSGETMRSSVVGIGLNVNQCSFPQMWPSPTSLALLMGCTLDRVRVLERLCEALEHWYLKLKNGSIREIRAAYLNRLLHFQQISVFEKSDGTPFQGRIIDVTPQGQLAMETDEGIQHFDTRQLRWLSLEETQM